VSEEILVNISPRETRVAIVENGVPQEIFIERASRRGLVGNIYMGKVARVLPGMQAAFINMGLERAAFLHVDDMNTVPEEISSEQNISKVVCIENFLKDGQSIAVQVIKDPLGSKGAKLTTDISLPSRYLVFMPDMNHIGVSQRIEDEEERDRLREALDANPEDGGFIVRTAAEGASKEDIQADKTYLLKHWQSIKKKMQSGKVGEIIHEDLPLYLRTIRDCVNRQTERIRIDDPKALQISKEFVENFVPNLQGKIEEYHGERPLFDIYGVEDEIQKALERKVQLKSGGYLIIDQTEAMTTIDVNTGAFVGTRNLDETIFKTNLEAATAIGRHLRLRNLGGIIIIDFIDMTNEEHKRQVSRTLEKVLSKDHTKSNVSEVSVLGLVEMTRKRTRESLEHILCDTCPVCMGRASVKTTETVCLEIFREVLRAQKLYDAKSYLVLAAQEVVDRMLDEESSSVAQLSDDIKKPIKFQVEGLYNQEQYDVVIM
jgi:ribonuclease G